MKELTRFKYYDSFEIDSDGLYIFHYSKQQENDDKIRSAELLELAEEGDERARRELDELNNKETMFTIQTPNCYKRNCKHFLGIIVENWELDGIDDDFAHPVCLAYPDGIPNDIAYGDKLHLNVRDDQKIFTFEKK